jgi:uncharacterized protein (TIGR02996 family)
MSDRDDLYRAILANPADDTPRLAYADWLEENGRPEEAEFIRIGCRLESITPDDPDFTELYERQHELQLWLSSHVPGPKLRFAAGLQIRGGNWWAWSLRGFPQFLHYGGHGRSGLKPMRMLGAVLEKAFARVPTRWLVVQGVTLPQLAELLKQPAIADLSGLTVDLDAPDEAEMEACRLIGECPRLRSLRALALEFPIGVMGLQHLAVAWENLGGMQWLSLDNCELLNPNAISWLRESTWFLRLQRLSLFGLPSAGFEELCRLPPLRLHTFELQSAGFEPAAWQTFARSSTFPRLTRLVNHTDMSRGGMDALAASDRFRFTRLSMIGSAIGDGGVRAMARAPWFDSLRALTLSGNRLGPAGVASLVRSRRLANLRLLDLRDNGIGGMGLQAIAANPALHRLTALLLGCSNHGFVDRQPTAADFSEFLDKLDMPELRHLDLAGRPVGPKAAQLLTRETYRSLTRLDLSECKLTDTAVSALLSASTLQNLIELHLSKNGLRDSLRPLADPGVLPRLSAATISGNRLPRDLERKLSRRPGIYI